MIVSHDWRFIFLKTQKTAGTSIEFALSAICGSRDVLTPTGPIEEEHLRLGRPAQNYLRDLPGRTRKMREDGVTIPDRKRDFWNHMPASLARQYLGDDIWLDYFKFAVVRNPWDREVSRYLFDKAQGRIEQSVSFREYILSSADPKNGFRSILAIDGQLAVDMVARYEDLERDLTTVLERIGWRGNWSLPHAKRSQRTETQRDYRDFYDSDTHKRVMECYADEIALFGYEDYQ